MEPQQAARQQKTVTKRQSLDIRRIGYEDDVSNRQTIHRMLLR